jgi:hypothetical protein
MNHAEYNHNQLGFLLVFLLATETQLCGNEYAGKLIAFLIQAMLR